MNPDEPTHRDRAGRLATRAKSKVRWARVTSRGKVHRVEKAIIRWNFMGGTFEKPDVTFVFNCGQKQRHVLIPVADPLMSEICARCDDTR